MLEVSETVSRNPTFTWLPTWDHPMQEHDALSSSVSGKIVLL